MNDLTPKPLANSTSIDEAGAIQALQDALEDFTLSTVGANYRIAVEQVTSESGKMTLTMLSRELSEVIDSYLNSKCEELANILKGDVYVSSAAHRGAMLILDFYGEYREVAGWSTDFSPLIDGFRRVGHSLVQSFDQYTAAFRDEIRAEFNTIIVGVYRASTALHTQEATDLTAVSAAELAQKLTDAFFASMDIEAVCGWRLGRDLRAKYRKTARKMEEYFGLTIELPLVQIDPSRILRSGNVLPQIW